MICRTGGGRVLGAYAEDIKGFSGHTPGSMLIKFCGWAMRPFVVPLMWFRWPCVLLCPPQLSTTLNTKLFSSWCQRHTSIYSSLIMKSQQMRAHVFDYFRKRELVQFPTTWLAIQSFPASLCGTTALCQKHNNGDMVQCDVCEMWYHTHCVGLASLYWTLELLFLLCCLTLWSAYFIIIIMVTIV